jgi:hypothetical protein
MAFVLFKCNVKTIEFIFANLDTTHHMFYYLSWHPHIYITSLHTFPLFMWIYSIEVNYNSQTQQMTRSKIVFRKVLVLYHQAMFLKNSSLPIFIFTTPKLLNFQGILSINILHPLFNSLNYTSHTIHRPHHKSCHCFNSISFTLATCQELKSHPQNNQLTKNNNKHAKHLYHH